MEQLYTINELVEILKVTERTVRVYIKEGKLGHIKFGRNVRVTQSQLDKFLKGE